MRRETSSKKKPTLVSVEKIRPLVQKDMKTVVGGRNNPCQNSTQQR